MSEREPVDDFTRSMLMEEVVHICPLNLSPNCEKMEKIEKPFTNHHINGDSSNSEYWNLIRICEPCHKACEQRKEDGDLKRKIKLKKRSLFINYFGPLAINVLKLAYKYNITSATPAMVLKLLDKDYLRVSQHNPFTIGASLKYITFQEYEITSEGKKLVEELLGEFNLPYDFSVRA